MSQTINIGSTASEDSKSEMTAVLPPVLQMPTMRRLSDLSNGHDIHKYKAVNDQILFTGNSLQLSKFTFEDNLGNEKSAEVIKKRFTVGNGSTSGDTLSVLSIAILKRHILCDCLLLVKQYRPSVKSYVLEFPAKIIEHSELLNEEEKSKEVDGMGEVAIKDVENSTGYKSTDIQYISPETALDPGLNQIFIFI